MDPRREIIRLVVHLSRSWDGIYIGDLLPDAKIVEWESPYELRKLTVSWTRTPSVGVVQDPDMCTFHFLNLTGGSPDATWNTTDYTDVETAFGNFWSAIKINWSLDTKLSEYLWRADGPEFKPYGDELSPTLRIQSAGNVAGGASFGSCPPQCAMSVTEVTESTFMAFGVGVPGSAPGTGRTQLRNRWGRFYLPALGQAALAWGRWDTAICETVATAAQAMYNACVSHDIVPVMYSPTTGSAFSINAVRVDDIVDVVRSRRYETPISRHEKLVDAA